MSVETSSLEAEKEEEGGEDREGWAFKLGAEETSSLEDCDIEEIIMVGTTCVCERILCTSAFIRPQKEGGRLRGVVAWGLDKQN